MNPISDELWFDANLNPAVGRTKFGIDIPDLPPAKIQMRFTAMHGRSNLNQAFDFYKFVLGHMPQEEKGRIRLIDFGGGWGRILRLFLREFPADQLLLLDCLTDAIECAKSLNPPFAIYQNGIDPPLPFEKACADCCYAFSVFSHLSERVAFNWLSHLCELLVPGGKLIITTRGMTQIRNLRQFRLGSGLQSTFKRLFRWFKIYRIHSSNILLPHPNEIQRLYTAGSFQFYPTGGGGELAKEFYGETWITEAWIKGNCKNLGFQRYDFFSEFKNVDQCVFVLTK